MREGGRGKGEVVVEEEEEEERAEGRTSMSKTAFKTDLGGGGQEEDGEKGGWTFVEEESVGTHTSASI